MIPRKEYEHLKDCAKQQGIPEKDLLIMVQEYWRSLKEELVTPRYNYIEVLGIGKMRTTYKQLQKKIKEITEDGEIGDIMKRNRLLPWQKLEEARREEWEREKLFKEIKTEYKRKKRNNES